MGRCLIMDPKIADPRLKSKFFIILKGESPYKAAPAKQEGIKGPLLAADGGLFLDRPVYDRIGGAAIFGLELVKRDTGIFGITHARQ